MASVKDQKHLKRYLEKLDEIKRAGQVDHAETPHVRAARLDKARKDYRYFVSYYFPHYATEPCADFHIKAASVIRKDENIALCLPWFRGAAKSTHMDVFVPLWLHLFHHQIKNMVLVGSTERAAKLLLQDVQAEFEANPQLLADFGTLVGVGNWAEGNFYTSTGAKFNALGKGQSPRGIRNGPHRPDYIVCDDLDEDEEIRNPHQVDKRVNWIKAALIPSMGTSGRIIIVNNIIGPRTIITEMMAQPGFKSIKVNALDEFGIPTWEARYSKDFFARKLRQLSSAAFEAEYMNAPVIQGKIFKSEYIQFKPRLKPHQYERIVACWDVAYSESESADCNAICVAGLTDNEKHILAIFCRTCTMEVALSWLYELHRAWPKNSIIEFYAESQFWNNAVELAMKQVSDQYGQRLPIAFLDRPVTNKYSRILQMLPAYQRGEIYYAEDLRHNTDAQRGINQIRAIEPGSKSHDDYPDAQAYSLATLEQSQAIADFTPSIGGQHRVSRRSY